MGDLTRLAVMHPKLARAQAAYFEFKAAAGLRRAGHAPGAKLAVDAQGDNWRCALLWRAPVDGDEAALERKRVTELGAEAIALAIVAEKFGWRIVMRLPEGQFADWLLADAEGRHIALEISGCATHNRYRLARKLAQVARHRYAERKFACVVEFGPPRAAITEATGKQYAR